ncbi:MAG: metallophosphoesterase [Clostridia bacterium]|nr:metallophosphoesterase [Clostridia bacterium]
MYYITGDTHGDFSRIETFCRKMKPTRNDVMIILGDAGFNYYGGRRDQLAKKQMAQMPITIFSIHGNHEMRPATIPSYHIGGWNGGKIYVEDEYPNLLFGIDGEVYNMGGLQTIVMGGAYSVDKYYRLAMGWNWFSDEQPSPEIKENVKKALEKRNWNVDIVLSHTTPLKYEPVEVFMPEVDQSKVDKSTETWLDSIENKLTYQHWYAGHYHTEKDIDRLTLLFQSIREFTHNHFPDQRSEKE